ncbi:mitochondrial carrier [Myriangium duriaei CBS 260.36]|uniref:Mitochondrial carrier n=1 Tax=Myriangium duriaei CBS 260.36 TaxID=1168546 RepID=A0A9P4MI69_9PEZI|nr:mitochondrial carrier [Myriangium duriaei CBS 260.36]
MAPKKDDENKSSPDTWFNPYSDLAAADSSGSVRRFLKDYRTPISSGTASVISTFVAFPLDFAKSRMQSYETRFIPTITDAYRAEGIRTFWRGVLPPLISVTAVRTASFSIYQRAKYMYAGYFERITGESPLSIANADHRYPNMSTVTCFGLAGATAGSIVTVLACPFELTKLRAQLAGKMAREQGKSKKEFRTDAWGTARQLIKDRGIAGLYCGYRLHLVRDTIGTSIYFMTYESAKQILGNARGASPTSPLAVMVGGGLCGIVSWACTYPVDVAKTVYQKALLATPTGKVEMPDIAFFSRGSYRGLGVSVARSCLINMIFFSMFEVIKKQINEI